MRTQGEAFQNRRKGFCFNAQCGSTGGMAYCNNMHVQTQQNACGKIFRATTYHFSMYFTICLFQQSRQLLHLALYRGQGNAPTIALITVTDGTAIAGSRQEATMCIQYVRRYSRLVPGTFSRAHRPTTKHCSY